MSGAEAARRSQRSRPALGALALAALLLVLTPRSTAHAQGAEPVQIRVEINDGGYNGNAEDYTVEVEQGQAVELTFVWAQQASPQDEHILFLDGYRLESDKINAQHRETTLKFVANQPGTFNFRCTLNCAAHAVLQRGYLKVKRSGEGAAGSAAVALTPTTLALSSSFPAAGSPLTLTAVLQDATGAPVPKADVRFYVLTEFLGVKGKMEIGVARTDAEGVALLTYQPTQAGEYATIRAHFEGQALYGESERNRLIRIVPSPANVVAPAGLEAVGRWVLAAFALALLGVWASFGFVLYQAYAIAREGTDWRSGKVASLQGR